MTGGILRSTDGKEEWNERKFIFLLGEGASKLRKDRYICDELKD